jgi:hypothetical protein
MDALAPIPDATLTVDKQLVLARMAGELGKPLRFRAVAVSNTHPWHRSSPQPKPVERQDALHMCKPHLHLLAREMIAGMPRCRPARSALAANAIGRFLAASLHGCGDDTRT